MTADNVARISFTSMPCGFPGFVMPPSAPAGMRFEPSSAIIVSSLEPEFDQWINMLKSRPEKLQEGLPSERVVFEAAFQNVEADGSTWLY